MINEIDVDDSGTVDFEGLLKHSNKEKHYQELVQTFCQASLF